MQEQILGDYRVLKQIGQGTLGAVLLAEHRFIKKQYILKVLPNELCQDRSFIERFEEEVAKLATLDHPHIVKIHNVSFAEGLYFLVTDCIVDSIGETTNLAQYMSGRKERLREDELLSVMGQIADALDYAHTKGQVAHRALKLNNILIGKGRPGIDVFISDFGLSKIVSPGKVIARTFLNVAEALQALPSESGAEERYSPVPIDAEKLTKLSQSFLQGYAFLAPEQKRFEQVGMQADVYAFGVLAYYLITGQFPEGAFEKPSLRAPDYRHDWDHLVVSCLQQDPTQRPTQLKKLLEQRKIAESVPAPRSFSEEAKEPAQTIEQVKDVLKEQAPQQVKERELVGAMAEAPALNLGINRPNDTSYVSSESTRAFDEPPPLKPIINRSAETSYVSNEPAARTFDEVPSLKPPINRSAETSYVSNESAARTFDEVPSLKPPINRSAETSYVSNEPAARTFDETPSLKPPINRSAETSYVSNESAQAPIDTLSLKPVINRPAEVPPPPPQAPPVEREAMIVQSKDVAEATPPPITPPKDESYSQQLNSMLNRDPVVTEYQPEVKESRHIEPIQSEMVVIYGGEFYRGSNSGNRDEMPRHRIIVESFALDVHPVTNEQFVRFLDFMGGEKDPNYNDLIRLKDSRINRSGGKLSIESGYAKHPVVGVTWYGAVAYAKWVGKRLPYEAEWEIAVRGGLENYIYPTGDNIEKSQANFFSSDTTKVMSYAPNAYGIYDMVGNVYEWCQDWYGYNYYENSEQEPMHPKGPLQGVYRVLRGGCWKSLKEDLRCSHRHRNNPGTVNSTYGFRCAADVQ